jgi:thiosulfate/3-mercaptopyruvate sulfurtransferase
VAEYQGLISARALRRHLDAEDWRIVDTRFRLSDPDAGRALYDQHHIPGAVYLHLDDDLSAPVTAQSGRHPLPEPAIFASTLGVAGIDRQTQVVVYDDAGGGIASRLWWMMRWLGHHRVAVLDGGFPAWEAAGYPVTAEVPSPDCRKFVARPDDGAHVSVAALRRAMARGDVLLVDAREAPRFTGETEPIDAVAGRIPAAVNLPWQSNLSEGGCLLSQDQLRTLWRSRLGSRAPDQVVCMCGSGVTACLALLAMEVAGLGGARLYAGSWSEWIRDPGRPVASGPD